MEAISKSEYIFKNIIGIAEDHKLYFISMGKEEELFRGPDHNPTY